MTEQIDFRTDFQKSKEENELRIYREFMALSSFPNASLGEVTKHIMREHDIHSASTVWAIRKRVGKRLAKEEMKKAEA